MKPKRKCLICEKGFKYKQTRKLYCSHKCQIQARRQRRAVLAKNPAFRAKAAAERKANRNKGKPIKPDNNVQSDKYYTKKLNEVEKDFLDLLSLLREQGAFLNPAFSKINDCLDLIKRIKEKRSVVFGVYNVCRHLSATFFKDLTPYKIKKSKSLLKKINKSRQ